MNENEQARTAGGEPDPPLSDAGEHEHPSGTPRVSLAIEETIAVVSMALLVLITLANVVVRYFTDESFAWTEELSIFLMGVLTLAGAAAAVARDRHIRIEFFYERGSPGRRRAFALLAAVVTVITFALMTVLTGRMAYDEWRYGETSMGIGIPRWWYTIWLPVLCAVIALRAAGWGVRRAARP